MIAKLTGLVDELRPTDMILDVNGVGYEVEIPFTTFEKIGDNKPVTLHIYTLHKEDQFRLFGFHDKKSKELFSILLKVNGIGPSMGIALLSSLSIDKLIIAVKENNISQLTKIPGIGKSKAEKIIFELSRKIKKLDKFLSKDGEEDSNKNISLNSHSDAIEALITLGFDEKKSSEIVKSIVTEKRTVTLEEIIKESLRLLSK